MRDAAKPKLGIALSDQQIPHMLKRKEGMDAIFKFIADMQPHWWCELGDFLDLTALNGWTRMSPEEVNWDSVRDEIAFGNDYLDEVSGLFKKEPIKNFTFGNHDERLARFKQKNYLSAYWIKNKTTVPYLMRDLKLKERGFKTHGQNDIYKIGKLWMFHGDNYSTTHTQKNMAAYGANLLYGHVHSPQRFTAVSRLDNQPRAAWSLGCLCNRNPVWKNGAPNAWVNGFAIFYVMPDGRFNLYPVDLVKGSFTAPNGKYYS